MHSRGIGWRVAIVLATAAIVAGPASSSQESGGEPRFVRAKSGGARIRNFQDVNGLVVRETSGGELLKVYGESVDFLEVEAHGGLRVWVYGKYLEPVEGDVMRVTASGVNMRPRAGSDVANMPIRSKLQRGDRIVAIQRSNPSVPLAEDWVEIWSPQSARGWVHRGDVQPVQDAAVARAEWGQPVHDELAALERRGTRAEPAEAPAKGGADPTPAVAAAPAAAAKADGSAEALREADRLYDEALASGTEDFTAVLAAYEHALEVASPGSTTAELVRRRIDETRARAEIAALQGEIQREKDRREAELARIREEQLAAEREKAVDWGRFDARGWLERRPGAVVTASGRRLSEEDTWVLRWAGAPTAEIVCSSGRYDLALFEGYELGVQGRSVREAGAAAGSVRATLGVIDLERIEVISGSGARR